MKTSKALFAIAAVVAPGLFWAATTSGAQLTPGRPTADAGVITGVVTGARGPEAGVWVIAETRDLPTKYVKIVVTDDRGRYLIPELPSASYDVWVRGYGLVDSPKRRAKPGATLNLRATPAPNARAAAQYYPAGQWFSLLQPPAKSEFPGTGPTGNGISPTVKNQAQWLAMVKSGGGCLGCHQLGSIGTRTVPPEFTRLGTSVQAWERRVQSGQAGPAMLNMIDVLGHQGALSMFADWTDRIAKGELPPAPRRPEGIERNVVITEWDWADPKAYLHDLVSTDRRKPTVNANGLLYGALEASADYLPVLDPVKHTATQIPLTTRDPNTPIAAAARGAASHDWGDTLIWTSRNNVHNPMLDERGRVWITSAVRGFENPDFCKAGSSHPSAKAFPLPRSSRHLAMYDPATKKLTHVSTCFATHHLMFAEDANNTLWTSGGGPVVGWLDTKLFEQTGDEERAQGWTPLVVDANGNGKRDAFVEPNQPPDPTKDRRVNSPFYGVAPAPDGSVWGSTLGYPGAVVRLVPGSNPTETALAEIYQLPHGASGMRNVGFSPRGMDVDRNGVVWAALASGHMASFDRRKCRGPLNGPTATGQHCPEGWSFWAEPLPQLKGVTDPGSAEGSYYTWVDQFDASGLGANTPINTGNQSEALLALKDGKWVILRVPYPLGFYTKWMDGRIDDPNGGWKGRGLWATVSTRAPFHMEGGKGTTSKVIKFQVRPDPLAR